MTRFVALTLLLAAGAVAPLRAQEGDYFTLTDGTLRWFFGSEADVQADDTATYHMTYDTVGGHADNPYAVYPSPYTAAQATLVSRKGGNFLALDMTDPDHVGLTTKTAFDTTCIWRRTGYTGYYYQNHGVYNYYLIGAKGSLTLARVKQGDPVDEVAYFYNWDFGAAITDITFRNGVRTKQYYWIMQLNDGTGQWTMSAHTYQRPDDRLKADNLDGYTYFDATTDGGGNPAARGRAAVYLPVHITTHERTSEFPEGKGLKGLTATRASAPFSLAADVLAYGEELALTPEVDIEGVGQVDVMPAYTEYVMEKGRFGMHTNYRERSADEFGSGGIVDAEAYYLEGGAWTTTAPTATPTTLGVAARYVTLQAASGRNVVLDSTGSAGAMSYTLSCKTVPPAGAKAVLDVRVVYSNGTEQTLTAEVQLSNAVETKAFAMAKKAPVVRGIVAGGGRMADVERNTKVTIVSCDSILAVYGGNDIAGEVLGDEGSTVTIGTSQTDADHPVRLRYVYGGGCGKYAYRGVKNPSDASATHPYASGTTSLTGGWTAFDGQVYPWGYLPTDYTDASSWDASKLVDAATFTGGKVPTIKRTNVTVAASDHVFIDSLFGGSENAFLTGGSDPATDIQVAVNGGTIFALFGGNNYGGAINGASHSVVTVNGTTLDQDYPLAAAPVSPIENSYFHGYGRDFGIRYLFGGGNLVESAFADVKVLGGMVDTCYLGGNMATVDAPTGLVDCKGYNYIFHNDSITTTWDGGTLKATKILDIYDGLASSQSPARFSHSGGRYNIRALFGGNNRAPMESMAELTLASGGVSHVYGGGNAGDMRGAATVADFTTEPGKALDGWPYETPSKIGTYIHAASTSKIIVEKLYGGCRMANVKNSTALWLQGGVYGYVYGGNDISGDVGSNSASTKATGAGEEDPYLTHEGTYVVVDGKALVLQSVYGGSNGFYHCTDLATVGGMSEKARVYADKQVLVDRHDQIADPYKEYLDIMPPTHRHTALYLHGGHVLHSAYGGGVMTNVGYENTSSYTSYIYTRDNEQYTKVDRPLDQDGTVHLFVAGQAKVGSETHFRDTYGDGNIYGGGFLSSIYGHSYTRVDGGSTDGDVVIRGSLYAGNDCMGQVVSFGPFTMPTANVDNFASTNGLKLNDPSDSYNSLFSTYLLIEGKPRINCVYGSGNGAYDYDGTRPEYSDREPVCDKSSASNRPRQKSVYVDIHTSGGMIDTVFGGGNGVGVDDNVTVLLNHDGALADATVGTIFGGNNRDNMAGCVPNIELMRGVVNNVYGGGNAGDMRKLGVDFYDICGKEVRGVSTHILVESDAVEVKENIYGGCRMADVYGMAYIEVKGTHASGINHLYGGNDISGAIRGNTRIDVSGGTINHIYGGSNGAYDYVRVADHDYSVYALPRTSGDKPIATHVYNPPYVDSTTVNLYGGTINNNVYGGGAMADCRSTRVELNDRVCSTTGSLVVTGAVYGGGEGDWQHLGNERRGNVLALDTSDRLASTWVHLIHATRLGEEGGDAKSSTATVYGGGRGGDVYNTHLYSYDTWDKPFRSVYGGCWGSDVLGTASVDLRGSSLGTAQNAFEVFGGNDYTGNVYKTELNIHSGHYGAVYGGGNGEYDYTAQPIAGATIDLPTVNPLPNSEYIVVNVAKDSAGFSVVVDSNFFGGGNLGTTWAYKKNTDGEYILDATGHKQPNNDQTLATSLADPTDYSYIITNIHGGTFYQSVFAGANGKDRPLVYGLKVLNMDGGDVKNNVYGGSQRVDDGYVRWEEVGGVDKSVGTECQAGTPGNPAANTTLRPSSILNVVGGTVRVRIYGAGYMGDTYGSTYVNLGLDAVDNSLVWSRAYQHDGHGSAAGAYALFKPGVAGSLSGSIAVGEPLVVEESVYGGANWGTNEGSFVFDKPGYYGGESRILIDGTGYNTSYSTADGVLPFFHIENNIIGTGTSVGSGDVLNRIDVVDYGGVDGSTCHASKPLHSIQRADQLFLWNTAIHYLGATDAISAYPSQQYTINRIRSVNARGYNVADIDALMTEIDSLNFYENDLDASGNLVLADKQALWIDDDNQCANANVCTYLSMISPTVAGRQYTALVVNNGVNVDIVTEKNGYGSVNGFGYLMAEQGTNAVVTARPKTPVAGGLNPNDGGFMSTCKTQNHTIDLASTSGSSIVWNMSESCTSATGGCEYEYNNYQTSYRVWSVGDGLRTRFAVILAHANPSQLPDFDRHIIVKDTNNVERTLALAHARLVLPPTEEGHYYTLSDNDGVIIEDDNASMRLVDYGWQPKGWGQVTSPTGEYDPAQHDRYFQDNDHGRLAVAGLTSGASASDLMGLEEIVADPASTFGLVMASGSNFKRLGTTGDDTLRYLKPGTGGTYDYYTGSTIINGNPHVNVTTDYQSAVVSDEVNASPVMDLYLTYSTEFATTMLGTIYFTLVEHDASGTALNDKPIKVAITVATLLENFKDMQFDMLAMYNEGRSNTYLRKAILPATLRSREVYLEKVEWAPDSLNEHEFYLTGSDATVTGADSSNVFRIGIQPVDNVTTTISSAVGWYTKAVTDVLDIFNASRTQLNGAPAETDKRQYSQTGTTAPTNLDIHAAKGDVVDLRTSGGKGIRIGELDGRGLAALNLQLTFDGNKVYPEDTALGHINLYFHTESGGNSALDSDFKIRLNVMSRPHGDTIFLATDGEINRCGIRLGQKNFNDVGPDASHAVHDVRDLGKSPANYIGTFEMALNPKIYREGDVIAIMDEVRIEGGKSVTIRGLDYAAIPVIRYSGHHHELPGECGVYRGTMIHVFGSSDSHQASSLIASSIAFDGSSVARITPGSGDGTYAEYYGPDMDDIGDKRLDTNMVNGPIILVDNGGVVSLQNATSVENNFNGNGYYTTGDWTRAADKQGAINVGPKGTLNLINNVDVKYNLSVGDGGDCDGSNPTSGAIYVHSDATGEAKVVLGNSHESTAVKIYDNYRFGGQYWKDFKVFVETDSMVVRYIFDDVTYATKSRRNVYLTRTEAETGNNMKDKLSDMIYFKNLIPAGTRIGISKWFPGPDKRDTIRFAYQSEGNLSILNDAIRNDNFVADEGCHNIFYNYNVSPQTIFLHRCATFQHQIASLALPYDNEHRLHDSVLEYHWLRDFRCPTGGDTVFYSVQGGFFPYTFSWWQAPADSRDEWTPVVGTEPDEVITTPYVNSIVMARMADASPDYAPYHESLTSYRLSPHLAIDHKIHEDKYMFRVEAKDVTGFCTLRKDITVNVTMSTAEASFTENRVENWKDTAQGTRAIGTRNFEGIKITPYVWAERSSGSIDAVVSGDPYIYKEDGEEHHQLKDLLFCEGDIIRLKATPKNDDTPFLMWDFDPYYSNPATYVVPNHNANVVAYFAPEDYWKNVINDTVKAGAKLANTYYYTERPTVAGYTSTDGTGSKAGFVTTHSGDVHIYDENGLAWLISVVNGLNGTQARPLYFNRVFVHKKADNSAYDMKDHLWTPVGSQQYGFRGEMIGVSATETDTAALTGDEKVLIKNIIVNEPNLDDAGFFALLDTASVRNIALESTLIRGSQYVGAFAGRSRRSRFDKCEVRTDGRSEEPKTGPSTTILVTRYVSGGMIGKSEADKVTNSSIHAKFVGNAVYSGGAVGYGTSTEISNSWASNTTRMNAVYLGALAGYLDGAAPVNRIARLFGAKASGGPSHVANNYVFLANDGKSQRVGGIAGHAQNAVIENNYVYGDIEGSFFSGGVVATLGNHGEADRNYYAADGATVAVGATEHGALMGSSAAFRGQGNNVRLSQRVAGVDNLTRVLNLWVRQQNANGANYRTWRSDLDTVNSGYPIFGEPDLIPVSDTSVVEGCEQVEWAGIVYDADAATMERIVDSVQMVDSTHTTLIRLHYGARTAISDSATLGEDYEGHGFFVSAAESALLRRSLDSAGHASLIVSDTLQTAFGCDSIVTLTLTFSGTQDVVEVESAPAVKVYPNPTLGEVNIEAAGMSRVEVFDNEGRTLLRRDAYDADRLTLDLAHLTTGVYYIRVHTPASIVIQKVIKR